LILFINITDTKRKDQESCYNKHRAHRCSGNIGITTCTTATVKKKLYTNFLRLSTKYTRNETRFVSYTSFQIIIYEPTDHSSNHDISCTHCL